MSTDKIEKKVTLRAPLGRVWAAVSDAGNFGAWFGVEFDGVFAPGTHITGRIAPTKVDAAVAKLQEPHAGKAFDFFIERMVPMQLFSFRWHPFAVDPHADYSGEPSTLVVFELKEVQDGTMLTITESGFDQLPLGRRAQAFKANEGGWTHQMQLIEKYLALGN